MGRQGDHRRRSIPGREAATVKTCDLRLHEPDGLGREDHGRRARTQPGKPVPISVDGKLENIGAYTEAVSRHVDAGRPEGRLHRHAQLTVRRVYKAKTRPTLSFG